ncbi:MAG: 6-carboxytetrahydropterin synthase QueD [Candidatus Omnitrophica bacterium]|nr:6-carboxytetrahydropterin synthase QueD [Candidatus Omnitrophota bacterium]
MTKLYSIKVDSPFSAAHNLRGYCGKCEKLHGHNWQVEVELAAEKLNSLAMVCDFKDIKKQLAKVLQKLDHQMLNKLPYFKKNNPTSEKIAEFIFYELKQAIKAKGIMLKLVRVWETASSSATFSEK